MIAKLISILFLTIFFTSNGWATKYYVNANNGNDSNKGNSINEAFKTIDRINLIQFTAGDTILFACGQQFTGMLSIANVQGSQLKPIVLTSFSNNGNSQKAIIDAGDSLHALYIKNASFIKVHNLEFTAIKPYNTNSTIKKSEMRCGILVETTSDENFESIEIKDVTVRDVFYHAPGFTRTAAEIKSANGTQSYGWGIRFINNSKKGKLKKIQVENTEIYNVSHTGLKFTANNYGIENIEISNCKIYHTGGPGMQFSGVEKAYIHHNKVQYSGSTKDSRNWSRGSGMWTWSCKNFIIEHNRFENANGPGDSAGVHIDYNCNDIIIQYNVSANNAGGFCEILGNNYNCTYRYNVSINDGFRTKGVNGAFQEGKVFWLSGYQGEQKKNAGPFNSYIYNNTIYVATGIVPKVAVSSSCNGILVANNIFYFEQAGNMVAGDQKKVEIDGNGIPNVVFKNNLFLNANSWPKESPIQDMLPVFGDAKFKNKGGLAIEDYLPLNKKIIKNKGIRIEPIPNDSIGLKVGLKVEKDILGNRIKGLPDMGAIELK